MAARLNVNIDHVATLRQARRTIEPGVVEAAEACRDAGAYGITVHLRSDRRHIQDADVEALRPIVSFLNLEMAATDEMIEIACRLRPDAVSLVPESPDEVTTEGGLNVADNIGAISDAIRRLKDAGITVSIFVDPDPVQIDAAKSAGADQVEICTAEYAAATLGADQVGEADKSSQAETSTEVPAEAGDPWCIAAELERVRDAAVHAHSAGLQVAAGHGLTTYNVPALAAMPEIAEFNIGHHIVSRAVFVGLEAAVREMIAAINVTA